MPRSISRSTQTHEHGLLCDTGTVTVGDATAKPGEIVYVPTGASSIRVEAGEEPTRLLLLGGAPLGEQIVMWWNFIGRSHDEIVDFRERWQRARETGGGGGSRRLRRLPGRLDDDAPGPRAAQPPPPLPRLSALPTSDST